MPAVGTPIDPPGQSLLLVLLGIGVAFYFIFGVSLSVRQADWLVSRPLVDVLLLTRNRRTHQRLTDCLALSYNLALVAFTTRFLS